MQIPHTYKIKDCEEHKLLIVLIYLVQSSEYYTIIVQHKQDNKSCNSVDVFTQKIPVLYNKRLHVRLIEALRRQIIQD